MATLHHVPLPPKPQSPLVPEATPADPPSRAVAPGPSASPAPRTPGTRSLGLHAGLEVDQIGDITVVKFTRRRLLTEEQIEDLGEQLFQLVDREGRRKLVINFAGVDRMTTALLGKLILLHRKLQAVNGWLVLCQIAPHLYEIFQMFRLPNLFAVWAEGEDGSCGWARLTA